ncbi:MAG TPA: aminoglycoside phosphotransferase family protein [Pseudonocardiaceae bacterium]|jgi:aminoglycoside phosphotransferase (APT) family kinase protein|nr:aminoglycoside phosphotransferase family protein [Pseudonocardiaceae bacterium]
MTAMVSQERQAELHAALTNACSAVGLDSSGAELLAYSSNVVYRLSADPVVVRLNLDLDGVAQTTELIRTSRWLESERAPIAPLAKIASQPVIGDGWAATFWFALNAPAEAPASALAEPLSAFHSLPPNSDLPEWGKFESARADLDQATDLDADDRAWLIAAWQQAETDYRRAVGDMPRGVVHGDAHKGNLLTDAAGHFVLCDLDSVAFGPIDWDLTPMAVSAARFARPGDQVAFAAAYGRDVTTLPWWPVLRRIRELVMVTYLVADLRNRPTMADQWTHRMHTLRTNQTEALWQRL